MKKTFKRIVSLAMCVVLLAGVMSISVFAANAEDYSNLPYKCYTYIGDSVSWGYGLDPSIETSDPSSIGRRNEGAFTDIVGKILEENNGAEVHSAASSGSRLCDYRAAIEGGMGVENPYNRTDDWFGNRTPERTQALRNKGSEFCSYISRSDLITFQLGLNDLTATLVNTACATGVVDLNKITAISDVDSVIDYIMFALGNLCKDPNVLGNVITAFNKEIMGLRENAAEIIKDIVTLAPEDADIVIVGYYNAAQALRIIPGSDYSAIGDFINTALVSLNDYYAGLAEQYDNVYFVAAPNAEEFYPEGTLLTEALTNASGILLGLHPNAAGHEYIAQCVLDGLKEINTCHHVHTKNITQTINTASGYGYSSSEVCTDCGKILNMGKIITPAGDINVPTYTIHHAINSINTVVTSTAAKLINGISSLFGKR